MIVRGRLLARWVRRHGLARSTVRGFRRAFLSTVPHLRLPGIEGPLAPAEFLARLRTLGIPALVALLRAWKEREPKYSLLGFYAR